MRLQIKKDKKLNKFTLFSNAYDNYLNECVQKYIIDVISVLISQSLEF